MRTKMYLAVSAALASLALAPVAFAQNTASPAPNGSTTAAKAPTQKTDSNGALSSGDRKFMEEAAKDGLAEVQLGQLAKDHGMSDEVKEFGNRMVTDHSKANQELKDWAQQKSVILPNDLDANHKALRDKLSKLSGSEFDKAYMREMVSDHEKDVAAFKKESTSAKDADLKNWAAKTLPTLEDHLKQAKSTAAKVGAAHGT